MNILRKNRYYLFMENMIMKISHELLFDDNTFYNQLLTYYIVPANQNIRYPQKFALSYLTIALLMASPFTSSF